MSVEPTDTSIAMSHEPLNSVLNFDSSTMRAVIYSPGSSFCAGISNFSGKGTSTVINFMFAFVMPVIC